MTRVGLVSDSHGKLQDLKRAVDAMGDVDLIIHMGDYLQDGEEIRNWVNIPVLAVKGNMDSYERKKPNYIKTIIEGNQVYVAHGHRQQVKWGTEDFAQTVRANNCRIGLYGHTHRKDLHVDGNVILINPGSCALPNDGSKSYAIMTVDGKKVDVDFYELD